MEAKPSLFQIVFDEDNDDDDDDNEGRAAPQWLPYWLPGIEGWGFDPKGKTAANHLRRI